MLASNAARIGSGTGVAMTSNPADMPTTRAWGPEEVAHYLRISPRHLNDIRAEDPAFPAPPMLGTLPPWSPKRIQAWLDDEPVLSSDHAEADSPTARTRRKGMARVH